MTAKVIFLEDGGEFLLEDDSGFFLLEDSSLDEPKITGAPEIQIPSPSEYKVVLKDQSGTKVTEFDNWLSLNFNHAQNEVSSCRFEIDGRDGRRLLFETDGQLEVWRRNKSVGLDWYIEWEGFCRTPNELITPGDDYRYVMHAISYLHLTKRSTIAWYSGTDGSRKNGIGETVIKEIVYENLGAGALSSNGRLRDHVYPGLSIEGDLGRGANFNGAFAWVNVLSKIRSIANKTGLVYDIVGIGDALFEFRVYEGQRGEDRTLTTGTNPLIFSIGYGNMVTPLLSINRGDEFTAAITLGQGNEDERQYAIAVSNASADTPWNDIEHIVKNTQLTSAGSLSNYSEAQLEEGKKVEALSFEVLQTASAFYGKDYTWGTKITAQFGNYQEDITFDKVDILVNKESPQERITTELSNKNQSISEE